MSIGFFKKYSYLFLIFFFIGFSVPVHCESLNYNDSGYVDAREMFGEGGLASLPDCGIKISDIVIAIAGLYASYSLIYQGIALMAGGPFAKAAGASLISAGIGIAATIAATNMVVACLYSFVRNPVLYDEDGNMKKADDPDLTTVNYYEAHKAAYADYIRVCNRYLIPFFGSGGCNKNSVKSNDLYDGPDSYLCPEEWRFLGYMRDPNSENRAIPIEGSPKYNPQLATMKLSSGPVECKTVKVNDPDFQLFSFKYAVRKMGSKICAAIVGIGGLNGTSRYTIGCHFLTPPPPAPMCDDSVPIRKDSSTDDRGSIIPGTGSGDIVGYDNSSCFSCYISQWCHFGVNQLSQSVLPISSPFIHCFKESMDLVLNGCRDGNSGQRVQEGFLFVAQQRLKASIMVTISLAIMFFAINALLHPSEIRGSEILSFVLKVAFVTYLTTSSYTETGGMQLLSDAMYEVSNEISNLMLNAGASNGLCVFDDDDYILQRDTIDSDGNISNITEDYSYLKLWDTIDCRLFFYLGGNLIKKTASDTKKTIFAGLSMIFMPLALIFTGLDIIPACACACVFIFCSFTIIWATLIMLLSIVGASIVILVSPVFIPMYLFSYTRGFFQGWLKEFVGYHLLPILVMAFMGFMFTIFDDLFFGDAKFERATAKILGKEVKYFQLDDTICDTSIEKDCYCKNDKIGCRISTLRFITRPLIFSISVTKIDGGRGAFAGMYLDLVISALITFLLVRFIQSVPSICGDLAGGARSLMYVGSFVRSPLQIGGTIRDQLKKLANKLSK